MNTIPVYLDANASEPVRQSVMKAMIQTLQVTGNPSSVHTMGRQCYHLIEDAREILVACFGGDVQNCIFTSGGTEADILAVHGQKQDRPLWVGATEHPAIMQLDIPKTILPVDNQGIIALDFLEDALKQTAKPPLVCIMLANNETGVINPIQQVAELCHQYGALLHVDAVQGAGRFPIRLERLGADSMAVSAHKMGGPKGVGALLLAASGGRGGKRIEPLFIGGGQEQGRRGGTPGLSAIVGMAEAAKEACAQDRTQILTLRNKLEIEIKKIGAIICGDGAERVDNTSYIAFSGISAQRQLMALDLAGFCVSTGSACSSGKVASSYVLSAMGMKDLAGNAIRVSLPWNVQEQDINSFIEAYRKHIGKI
ncbi:cysteine desulfurase family protein [Commensalibacter oyaizuii]|uniref:Cysteine desulfurase n=1 Tax=Commensalibacter oyaizuii TaxID=3043873 RepID=A0ABT6Q392_9PROT|nr:cysteine desulfurase family protein [Commensalibacter sp. TBRC 16381]MDI2091569.1 cysteine desulfurase family protein [Commensalibacter sp. TBRC 16381]